MTASHFSQVNVISVLAATPANSVRQGMEQPPLVARFGNQRLT